VSVIGLSYRLRSGEGRLAERGSSAMSAGAPARPRPVWVPAGRFRPVLACALVRFHQQMPGVGVTGPRPGSFRLSSAPRGGRGHHPLSRGREGAADRSSRSSDGRSGQALAPEVQPGFRARFGGDSRPSGFEQQPAGGSASGSGLSFRAAPLGRCDQAG